MECREVRRLVGHDARGRVYDAGNFILREITQGYFSRVREVYRKYCAYDLAEMGIVRTSIRDHELALEHEKHVISYPYEWTPNMYKDALLFHLQLFLRLEKSGLTLKDGLPSNVLFDFHRPVFVDFLSLLSMDALRDEQWLFRGIRPVDPRFAVLDMMLTPFFIIPFVAFALGKSEVARRLLRERACNVGTPEPTWRDLLPRGIVKPNNHGLTKGACTRIRPVDAVHQLARAAGRRVKETTFRARRALLAARVAALAEGAKITEGRAPNMSGRAFRTHCRRLIEAISAANVTPRESGYHQYYRSKDENYSIDRQSGWRAKQREVWKLLVRLKPRTVLDLGANTGWFSRLAERAGASVIATDVDEASVDELYRVAKRDRLRILPLVVPLTEMKRETYCAPGGDSLNDDDVLTRHPLHLAPQSRLRSELVLCLALIHHLLIALREPVESVVDLLDSVAERFLVVEWIDADDVLIKSDPAYFPPHLARSANYDMQRFIETIGRRFRTVEHLGSHPATRRLLVFGR